MVQRRVLHTAARRNTAKIKTPSSASKYNRVTGNAVPFLFRASIVVLSSGPTDFHSAVIALSSFKLCLLGGELVFCRYQKIKAKNRVGVKDKSTKQFLLFTSIMLMLDECKTTLHQ